MNDINTMTGLNISVYHSFEDEVDSYRQHVWLCDGSCRKKPPFFGIVKRAKNMAPAPRDDWCMFIDSPNLYRGETLEDLRRQIPKDSRARRLCQ